MKSRCVSRELTIEMIVGTFVASVFVVLVLFTIVISGGRFMRTTTEIKVYFDEVMGLRRRDMVLVRGVPAGSVEELTLDNDRVRVLLQLTQPVRLRTGYSIRVVGASILGGNHLIIDEGQGEPLDANAEIWGERPTDLMRDVGELVSSVRETLIGGGVLENFRRASEDVAALTARLRGGDGSLGRLFSDDDTLYRDLSGSVADVKELTARLTSGQGFLGRLLAEDDGGMFADARATIASLREVTERVERGEGTVGRLLSADDSLYHDLAATAGSLKDIAARVDRGEGSLGLLLHDDRMYTEWAETGANLRLMTARLEAGEGTLGRLLSSDDHLYREVEGLLHDARETLDDMRETSPVVMFSSILFGAF